MQELRPASPESSSSDEHSDQPELHGDSSGEDDDVVPPSTTHTHAQPGVRSWQKRLQENRLAAAAALPLMKSIFLTVQEGFHPGITCSTRTCNESKLLLRCLECSPTLLFCSCCWLHQHGVVRTQHVPELHADGWHPVTHFVRTEQQLSDDSGAINIKQSYYPVCSVSSSADLPGRPAVCLSFHGMRMRVILQQMRSLLPSMMC